MRLVPVGVIAASALLLAACASERRSTFEFREATPASLELLEGGKPVFVYNHGMVLADGVDEKFRRSSYLHPIHAPDGTVLTADFPEDHPHHRGACWAWPDVRFLEKTYDVWAVEGMHQRFVNWKKREISPDAALLSLENGWYAGDRKAVSELVEITVQPAQGNKRVFDIALTFEAVDEPVQIAGREKKGYGGFGVRFAPRTNTVLRTEAGVEEKDSDMVPHSWAELEATFGDRRAGMRIEDAPGNPGEGPVGWCLRHYGYLGANYPGLESVTLLPGKPLKLRYRVTVFSAT
ncbi:MAG: DUF6807 family protein [Bryobacterales bacterium]|nr:DUF6807 family protein [Bryobacterales bacterium]